MNELLASGITYKAWLLHMINVRSDADIAVAKALRNMLQVTKSKNCNKVEPFRKCFVLPKRYSFIFYPDSMRQFFSEMVAFWNLNGRAFQNSETVTVSEL